MCMNRRGSSFFSGVFVGALVGAAAAILLAPASGQDTRKKIRQLVDENGDILQDAKEKTEEAIHKTMDAIKTGMDKLGRVVEERRRPHSEAPMDDSEAAA